MAMEKRTPHYDLATCQSLIAQTGVASFTKTALDGGRNMGLTTVEMLTVLVTLEARHFYK